MMVIGSLIITFEIPGNNSLKGKRRILKSLTDRIKNKYNVSIAEVDNHDKHQLATVGIAFVSNDSSFVNKVLDQIVNMVDMSSDINLIDYSIEIL